MAKPTENDGAVNRTLTTFQEGICIFFELLENDIHTVRLSGIVHDDSGPDEGELGNKKARTRACCIALRC